MLEVILCVVGLIVGVIIGRVLCKPKLAGSLCLCEDDSGEGISLFVELDEEPEKLHGSRYVVFGVKEIR